MAANNEYFMSYWPRFKVNYSKEFLLSNDVSEANLTSHKRILFYLTAIYEKLLLAELQLKQLKQHDGNLQVVHLF